MYCLKNKNCIITLLVVVILFSIFPSCSDVDLYKGNRPSKNSQYTYTAYLYPFSQETTGVEAEITLVTDGSIDLEATDISIPSLKYNKSWLFLLTQDDCKQSAYCRTWAAINGKPISNSDPFISELGERELFYSVEQLENDDLPPNTYLLNKTLGSTDGCGNEVRFHITTTLAPEWDWMNAPITVRKGFTENYYRFFMKSGLAWNDIKEMLNFGTGIAFHDVMTDFINDQNEILKHYIISQDSIVKNLSGRHAKMLAEPNGNKTYVEAALMYDDIQTMTAQAGAEILYPQRENNDLYNVLLNRIFNDNPDNIKEIIKGQNELPLKDRQAVYIGVHQTSNNWIELLEWINNTYGKDGSDSVWFPSQEEYYEYNYYRSHAQIKKTIEGNTLKIKIKFPQGLYFYYPSLTINIDNVKKAGVKSIATNDAVNGLSYGAYADGIMINFDCRKFLLEQATHYVEKYEKNKTNFNLVDAEYLVGLLKDSSAKSELGKRLK